MSSTQREPRLWLTMTASPRRTVRLVVRRFIRSIHSLASDVSQMMNVRPSRCPWYSATKTRPSKGNRLLTAGRDRWGCIITSPMRSMVSECPPGLVKVRPQPETVSNSCHALLCSQRWSRCTSQSRSHLPLRQRVTVFISTAPIDREPSPRKSNCWLLRRVGSTP